MRVLWHLNSEGKFGDCQQWLIFKSACNLSIWVDVQQEKARPVSSVDAITVTIILCSLVVYLSSTSLYPLIGTMAFQINVKLFVGDVIATDGGESCVSGI